MRLLAAPSVTRNWPWWVRYLLATLLIIAIAALETVWRGTLGFPFLFYLSGVILCAVFFDQGTSLFATFLSGAFAAYLSLEPRLSFAIANRREMIALIVFLAICVFTGFFIELLHVAVLRLHMANQALREANSALAAAERENDLLLREAAHRTKNDLATLIGLIRLDLRRHEAGDIRDLLQRFAERVQVFAKLQDRLSRAQQQSVVNVGEYIDDLCEDLAFALAGTRQVALNVSAEGHVLPASQAVALGLITNELVTNALKHAFSDEQPGAVDVTFIGKDGMFLLCVEDDGRGLPDGGGEGDGNGQRLVSAMVQQLNGSFELRNRFDKPGTFARVRFPAPARAQSASASEPECVS